LLELIGTLADSAGTQEWPNNTGWVSLKENYNKKLHGLAPSNLLRKSI
jgi:hypothetical protein